VLVVVHTGERVLLLRRVDPPDFWQSVTGSLRWDEAEPIAAARRELFEETGLEDAGRLRDMHLTYRFPILPAWRARYAPEVKENTEHVFSLALPAESDINVNSAEHAAWGWFDFDSAAARATSWTNREAIRKLQGRK
jgi:dATP pyrophosphohydrolase